MPYKVLSDEVMAFCFAATSARDGAGLAQGWAFWSGETEGHRLAAASKRWVGEVSENDYEENFPHRDLWAKPDAMLKWISILREFKSIGGEKLKVVDLGAGPASLPHIISSLGHDVTAIDIADINHLVKQSLVKMVLGDVLYELKNIEDESVDVFIDSCAVTHFKPSGNAGWKEVAEHVHRALKPGGKFIVSSDVDENVDEGEFIKTKNSWEYSGI